MSPRQENYFSRLFQRMPSYVFIRQSFENLINFLFPPPRLVRYDLFKVQSVYGANFIRPDEVDPLVIVKLFVVGTATVRFLFFLY